MAVVKKKIPSVSQSVSQSTVRKFFKAGTANTNPRKNGSTATEELPETEYLTFFLVKFVV